MIWKEMKEVEEKKTGEDKLGNSIYEFVEAMSFKARFSPWTAEDIALEGREVTKQEQKYLIPCGLEQLDKCQYVEIDKRMFEVTQVSPLSPRWTLLQVRKYR